VHTCVHVCVYFFNHSFIKEYLGCFHILAIVQNAAVSMGVQVPLANPVFSSFEYFLIFGGPSYCFL
jgi:hypothetical protein